MRTKSQSFHAGEPVDLIWYLKSRCFFFFFFQPNETSQWNQVLYSADSGPQESSRSHVEMAERKHNLSQCNTNQGKLNLHASWRLYVYFSPEHKLVSRTHTAVAITHLLNPAWCLQHLPSNFLDWSPSLTKRIHGHISPIINHQDISSG